MVMGNGDLFLKSKYFEAVFSLPLMTEKKKQDLKQKTQNKNQKTMKKQTSSTATKKNKKQKLAT